MSKFESLFTVLHYIWILPIQGIIIALLIWQCAGVASLAGVILIIIQTIPLQGNLQLSQTYTCRTIKLLILHTLQDT